MTYLQAFVIALIQGVTELFPVSSLGHSVLIPAWLGGSWQAMVTQSSQQSSESSFYLAYIVALHCATALALMWFFRADWVRIIRGFFRSLPAPAQPGRDQHRMTQARYREQLGNALNECDHECLQVCHASSFAMIGRPGWHTVRRATLPSSA